jgi:hypothetical protein
MSIGIDLKALLKNCDTTPPATGSGTGEQQESIVPAYSTRTSYDWNGEEREFVVVNIEEIPTHRVPANTKARKFDTRTIEQRFLDYHMAHPEVYRKLVEYAHIAKARGYAQLGIGYLWEIIRWQENVAGTKEKYKMSNDYRAHYSRMIMREESGLAGFFTTRQLETP